MKMDITRFSGEKVTDGEDELFSGKLLWKSSKGGV
jgi:hypothetical protein